MKEIAKAISEASDSINANTTGSVYVNKGNAWAYKITPGNTINITSQMGTHTYAVMGFNNFALSIQSNYGGTHTTAGLTFGMVDCIAKEKMNETNTNSGGWGDCKMSGLVMNNISNLTKLALPDEILATVKVPYATYNNQNTLLYTTGEMFLPAAKEVFGEQGWSTVAESKGLTQFAYYKNGGSKIKSLSGSATFWWLRSVPYTDDTDFCDVTSSGFASTGNASFSTGVAPCFCV